MDNIKKEFDKIEKDCSLKYWAKDGTPMSMYDWVKRFDDMEYRRVGLYQNSYIRVSTVWLGLDHSFGVGGKLLIFETMVFPKGSLGNIEMDRYSTLEEAQKGHRRLVRKYRSRQTNV